MPKAKTETKVEEFTVDTTGLSPMEEKAIARINTLKERLTSGGLNDKQKKMLETQIESIEAGLKHMQESGHKTDLSSLPDTPEGLYVSQVKRVHTTNRENPRTGRMESRVGLIMEPIKKISIDDDGELIIEEMPEDFQTKGHWITFNKNITAVKNPQSSVESALSKFLSQLGVGVEGDVADVAPFMLDEQLLVGLRLIEQVTHNKSQDGSKTYANSSMTKDTSVGVYKVSYRKEAIAIQKHNKPIIADFLELDEEDIKYKK